MQSRSTADLQIGALAALVGVSVRACRLYERRGLLPLARRTAAGYRVFDARHVQAAQRIVALGNVGFTLREIAHLLTSADWCAEIDRALTRKESSLLAEITELDLRLRAVQRLHQACLHRSPGMCGIWPIIDYPLDPAPQGRRIMSPHRSRT